MTDIEIFELVVDRFKEQYPNRQIEVYRNVYEDIIVSVDGEEKFNIKGFCLLYNLKRLCECLEKELI